MTYEIKGGFAPVVVCRLEDEESMACEKGAMVWMSPNIEMQTQAKGGIGRALGRKMSRDSFFQNVYTSYNGKGLIAFGSSYPGSIIAVPVTPSKPVIAQKTAFLAATIGVESSIFFQKKISAGLFGGEGFIMQKFTGNGTVFLEIDGSAIDYNLHDGQMLVVNTGNIAMVDATCKMDVQAVKGIKNIVLGGEGLFLTTITGPGRVSLQTLPARGLAESLIPYLPLNRYGGGANTQ